MEIRTEMIRRHGRWLITMHLPRWLLNDLEHEGGGHVTLTCASTGISSMNDDAQISFVVKQPSATVEIEAKPDQDTSN